MIDVAFLIRPGHSSVSSNCWNEDEIVILTAQTFQLFHESRVIGVPIGVKQIQFVFQTFLSGMLKNASNRCNSDAASQKYRWPGRVFVQRERSPGTADHELRTKSGGLQGGFEDRLTHTHGDHDRFLFLRTARQREGPEIIVFTSLARMRKHNNNMLPGSEFEVAVIGFEPESHGVRGN